MPYLLNIDGIGFGTVHVQHHAKQLATAVHVHANLSENARIQALNDSVWQAVV